MPSVVPSQAMKIPAVSLRPTRACPQPGSRNERQKAAIGLVRSARESAAVTGRDVTTAESPGVTTAESGVAAVESWAAARTGAARSGPSPRTSHAVNRNGTRERWRERVGIEPTGATEGVSVAVLKTGQTTRPDPLPSDDGSRLAT